MGQAAKWEHGNKVGGHRVGIAGPFDPKSNTQI